MSRKFLSSGRKKSGKKSGSMGNLGKLLRSGDMSKTQMINEKNSHSIKSHSEMLEDLLDEKLFNTDPRKNAFHLPGTKKPEERQMTKGMKAAIEAAQMGRLKKRQKANKRKGLEIKAQAIGGFGKEGGRVTADGKIMSNDGKVLFKINTQTGKITDGFGIAVGKYKPGSVTNEVRMERLLQSAMKKQNKFNPFALGD